MDGIYCLSCYSTDKNIILKSYTLRNNDLKSMFKVQELTLCLVCMRLAKRFEDFIENIQSSLKQLSQDVEPPAQTLHKSIPQIRLAATKLNDIYLPGAGDEENNFIIYGSSKEVEENKFDAIEAKVECLSDLDNDDKECCFDFNNFQNEKDSTEVKDFKDDLLKHLIEYEVNTTSNQKPKRKRLKNKQNKAKKIKTCRITDTDKRVKIKDETNLAVKQVHIDLEQCKQELKNRAMDTYYTNAPFKCTDCVKAYRFKASFESHMMLHDKSSGELICDICKQRRKTTLSLQNHMRGHIDRFACSVCGLTQRDRRRLSDHILTHADGTAPQLFNCQHCDKVFSKRVALKKHVVYKHGQETATCGHCHKRYANKATLRLHIIMMHPAEISESCASRNQVCGECGMSFTALSILEKHKLKHTDRRDFYCVECDKNFKTNESLKRHLSLTTLHVSNTDLPLGCDQCDKRFSTRRDLQRHLNTVHLNLKPYQCDLCHKAFHGPSGLQEHKKFKHDGFKRPMKFPCSMCSKVFDRNCILKEHFRIHTGERPYQCDRCPASFTQSSVLRTHVRGVHLNVARDGRPRTAR